MQQHAARKQKKKHFILTEKTEQHWQLRKLCIFLYYFLRCYKLVFLYGLKHEQNASLLGLYSECFIRSRTRL
jgi:hypothetical protein